MYLPLPLYYVAFVYPYSTALLVPPPQGVGFLVTLSSRLVTPRSHLLLRLDAHQLRTEGLEALLILLFEARALALAGGRNALELRVHAPPLALHGTDLRLQHLDAGAELGLAVAGLVQPPLGALKLPQGRLPRLPRTRKGY